MGGAIQVVDAVFKEREKRTRAWLVSRQSGERVVHRQHRANNVRGESATDDRHPERSERSISFFCISRGPSAAQRPARQVRTSAAPEAGWDLPVRASEWMDSEWPHAWTWALGLVLTREVLCGWGGPVETQPAQGLQLTTSYAACWQVQCRSKKGKKRKILRQRQ